MADVGGIESYVSVALKGVETIKQQIAELKKDAAGISTLEITGKIKLPKEVFDDASLRKAGADVVRELQKQLKELDNVKVDFKGVRENLSKAFDSGVVDREVSAVERRFGSAKTLIVDNIAQIKTAVKSMNASLNMTRSAIAMNGPEIMPGVNERIAAISGAFNALSTGVRKNMTEMIAESNRLGNTMQKDLARVLNARASVASRADAARNLSGPLRVGGKFTMEEGASGNLQQAIQQMVNESMSSAQVIPQKMQPVEQAFKEIGDVAKDAAAHAEAALGNIKTAADGTGSGLTDLGGKLAGIEGDIISFEQVSRAMTGSLHRMFDIAPGQLKESINEITKSLQQSGSSPEFFSKLFGPETLSKVQRLQDEMSRLNDLKSKIGAKLAEDGAPGAGEGADDDRFINNIEPGSAEAKAMLEVEQQINRVLAARKDVADSYLATQRAARVNLGDMAGEQGTLYRGNAAAAEELVKTTERHKANITHILGLLGEGADATQMQTLLYREMVSIIKAGGDAEGKVVAQELERLDVMKKTLAYADKLRASAESMASLPQSGATLGARKALLDESSKAYRASAAASQTNDQFAYAMKGAASAEAASTAIASMQGLRESVINVASEVEKGLAPAYDKIVQAVELYSKTSSTAFKGNAKDVQVVGHALAAMQRRANILDSLWTPQAKKEMEALLQTVQKIGGTIAGTTDNAKLKAHFEGQQGQAADLLKTLEIERLREQAVSKIMDDYGKLTALQAAGVNTVTNAAKLEQLYISALKDGVSIEEKATSLTVNKAAALRSLVGQYNRLNEAAKEGGLDEELRLALLRQAADAMRAAAPMQKALGRGVRVEGQNISQATINSNLAAVNAEIAAVEREKAKRGELVSLENAGVQLARERSKMENDILNTIARSAQVTQAGMADYDSYAATVKAVLNARKHGVDTARAEADMTAMSEQAMRNLLTQEQALAAVVANETQSYMVRTTAAKDLLSVVERMGQLTKAGSGTLGVSAQDVANKRAHIQAQADSLTKAMAAQTTSAPDSLADVIRTPVTGDVVAAKRAGEAEKIAAAVKQAREEMLSGVSVLENWQRLQNLSVEAAKKGVTVDEQSLRLLYNKEAVMERVAAAATRVAEVGAKSAVPGVAATAYKQLETMISELEKLSGGDVATQQRVGVAPAPGADPRSKGALKDAAAELRAAAGSELPGSFAKAQTEAAELAAKIGDISSALHMAAEKQRQLAGAQGTTSKGAAAPAYERSIAAVDRILAGLEQWKAKEKEIASNAEFLAISDEKTLESQFAKVREIERVVNLLKKARAEQEKFSAALARTGDFTPAKMTTDSGAGAAARSANEKKENKSFVQATDSVRQMLALNKELRTAINNSDSLKGVIGGLDTEFAEANMELDKMNRSMSALYRGQQDKASRAAGTDLFDRARLMWFAQLRMFWTMFVNIQDAISSTIQFQHTLNVMRAVTQTSATNMGTLADQFFQLGQVVPIAISGIADATLSVAKAGYSAGDAMEIVAASAKLAQGAQADIKKVADLQTVIMRAWDKNASDAESIADKLMNAVNKSRADIDGLDQAIGYVAGIAPQANVTLEQVLGMVAILTNAGLSMSKAGTYMRQFLNDLMNPSEKLVSTLGRLGLTVSDIDPRMHKIGTIFKKLSEAGMTVSDAFEGMSVRAASAFSILLNNSNLIDEYTDAVSQQGTVVEAHSKTIDDLASKYGFMQNAMLGALDALKQGFGPIMGAVTDMFTAIFNNIRDGILYIERFGAGTTGVLSTLVASTLGVGSAMLLLRKSIALLTPALAAVGLGKFVGEGSMLVNVLGLASFKLLGVVGVIAALGTAVYVVGRNMGYFSDAGESALDTVTSAAERTQEAIDNLRASTQKEMELRLKVTEAKQTGATVAAYKDDLDNKYGALDTPGKKKLAGFAQGKIAEEFRKNSLPEIQEIGNEMQELLIITPDIDTSVAKGKLEKFMKLYEDARKLMQKAPEDLAENLGESDKRMRTTVKEKDLAFKQFDVFKAMEKEAAKENERNIDVYLATDYSAAAYKPIPGHLGDVKDNIEGRVDHLEGRGFKGWAMGIKNLSALRQEFTNFEKYATENHIPLVMEGPNGEIKSWKEDFLMIADFEEARDFLIKAYKATADSLSSIQFQNLNTDGMEAVVKTTETFVAAISAIVNNTSGTEVTKEALVGAKKDIDDLTAKMAEAGITAGNVMFAPIFANIKKLSPAIDKQLADIERRIRSNQQITDKDAIVVATASSKSASSVATVEGVANDAKMFYENAGKLEYGSQLSRLIDTDESRDAMTMMYTQTREEFAALISQFKEIAGDVPFDKMSKEIQKSLTSAVKAMYQAEVAAESMYGKMDPEKYIAIAERMRAIPGAEALNIDEMLKIGEAGRGLLESLRDATKLAVTDSVGDVAKSVENAWTTVAKANRAGFGDVHDSLAEEAYKITKTYLSMRNSIVKTINASNKEIGGFELSTGTTKGILSAFSDISAVGTMLGKAEKSALDAREEIEKLADTFSEVTTAAEDMREVTDLFSGLGVAPVEATKAMEQFATTASGKLATVTASSEKVRDSIKSLTEQLVTLKLEMAKADFDFGRKIRAAQEDVWANSGDRFVLQQQEVDRRRDYIKQNAQNMTPETMKVELTGLQDELIELFKNNHYTEQGRAALKESVKVQDMLREMNQLEQQRVQADLAVQSAMFERMMQTGNAIVSVLTEIKEILSAQRDGAQVDTEGRAAAMKNKRGDNGSQAAPKGLMQLSARYESGSDPSRVGYDSTGGTSYGKFQIASKKGADGGPSSMDAFLAYLDKNNKAIRDALLQSKQEHADKLKLAPKDAQWNTGGRDGAGPQAWKDMQARFGEEFTRMQEGYIKDTHYTPVVKATEKKTGVNLDKAPEAVKAATWSTAVQHKNYADDILAKAMKKSGGRTDESFLKELYAERKTRFTSSTPEVRRSVQNRMDNELRDAIAMLRMDAIAAGKTPDATKPAAQSADSAIAANVKDGTDAMVRSVDNLAATIAGQAAPTQANVQTDGGSAANVGNLSAGLNAQTEAIDSTRAAYEKAVADRKAIDEKYIASMEQGLEKSGALVAKADATVRNITIDQSIEKFRSQFANANELVQSTFEGLMNTATQGIGRAASAGLRDVVEGTSTMEDAFYDLSWSMIDMWMQSLSQAAMQSMLDPTFKFTDFLGFGGDTAASTVGDVASNTTTMATDAAGMATQTVSDATGVAAGAATDAAGAAAYQANIAMEQANLAMEQGNLTMEQALLTQKQADMAQDQAMSAQKQAQDQALMTQEQQNNTQLMTAATGLQTAATALQTAASALQAGSASKGAGDAASKGAGILSMLGGAHHEGGPVIGRHEGGIIPGFAGGGQVIGGNRQKDSVTASLTKGEFVVQEPAVRAYGVPFMKALNEGNSRQISEMLPGSSSVKSSVSAADSATAASNPGGGGAAAGQQSSRGGKNGLNIMNVVDQSVMERSMTSQRGRTVISSIVHGEIKRMRG